MIHENMSSWKELITLKLYPNRKICIWIVIVILLRSYNYDTYYNDSNKEESVNNLISPIEFNLVSCIGFNQKHFAKSTRISTKFQPLIQPDSKVGFNMISLVGSNQKWFAKSKPE